MDGYTYRATLDASLDRISDLTKAQRTAVSELDQLTSDRPDLLADPHITAALDALRS